MPRSVRRILFVLIAVLNGAPCQSSAGTYTFSTIDFPSALFTNAYGINDRGQVVGFYEGSHGFLDTAGVFSTIDVPGSGNPDVPGSANGAAFGINNRGQIVGSYSDLIGAHGFLDTEGFFTTIDIPGAGGLALGINDRGEIVGRYI